MCFSDDGLKLSMCVEKSFGWINLYISGNLSKLVRSDVTLHYVIIYIKPETKLRIILETSRLRYGWMQKRISSHTNS